MQTFAIVNLALTALLLGYAVDHHDNDEQAIGAFVLVVVLNIVLCVVVLLHG